MTTTANIDPNLRSALDNLNVIAASEGGSIELVEAAGPRLVIEYTPGVNEECPECVPTHDLIEMMLKSSLSIAAPYVSEVEVR